MPINATNSISASERLARQDYARQLQEIELEKEPFEEVDFELSGMTIDEFKASGKYEQFANRYKHQTKFLKSHVEHKLPLSVEEKQVFGAMLDDYMVGAFYDSKSKFKRFSDTDLKKHVYTGMRKNVHDFSEAIADVDGSVSMDDIMRATILFLPEQGKNPAWAQFCMEQALQSLKAAQEHALQLPKHQAEKAVKSPIFYAVSNNKFDTAHSLLRVRDKAVNPEEVDRHGRNILHLAAFKGDASLSEELAAMRSPRFNPAEMDHYDNHALHLAVMSGSLPTVKAMMNVMGENAFKANNAGKTPLHIAAEMKSNNILDFLVKNANENALNATDQNGNTAAQISANMNNPTAVKQLVNSGTNTSSTNNADQSLHALMMNLQGEGGMAKG